MSEVLFRIKKELESVKKRALTLEQESRDQKRINEALKYVTSVVLHELKTPLKSTSEYMARLKSVLGDRLDDREVEGIFDIIERNIRQMNYIMAHLDPAFDVSANVVVEVNLYELVESVYDSLRILNKSGVHFVNSVPEEL